MSKSQKKVIRRVTTFLKNGECEKNLAHTEQAEREPFMKCEVESNLFVFLTFFLFRFKHLMQFVYIRYFFIFLTLYC